MSLMTHSQQQQHIHAALWHEWYACWGGGAFTQQFCHRVHIQFPSHLVRSYRTNERTRAKIEMRITTLKKEPGG